jgi:hypothetical protein
MRVTVLALLLLAGCATGTVGTLPTVQHHANAAMLVVVRPCHYVASAQFTRAYPSQVIEAQSRQTYYFRIGPHDAINSIHETVGRQLVGETTSVRQDGGPN